MAFRVERQRFSDFAFEGIGSKVSSSLAAETPGEMRRARGGEAGGDVRGVGAGGRLEDSQAERHSGGTLPFACM